MEVSRESAFYPSVVSVRFGALLRASHGAYPTPGTYTLNSTVEGIGLNVELKHDDETCNQSDVVASSATLVLTTSTTTGATGTLTALINGSTVQFAFDAAGCTRNDSIPFACEP
jgi:hypothetical protein